MITSTDIALLQALQNNPLKSNWAISEEVGISAPTVKKRFERLAASFPHSFDVEAIISYERIGLILVDVYLALHKVKDAPRIEHILHRHNYIRFTAHAIGIGANTGIFAQFVIPATATRVLSAFLEHLVHQNLVASYDFKVQTSNRISKFPELDAWDQKNHKWNINSQTLLQSFQAIATQEPSALPEITTSPYYPKLSKTHLIILEELSFDARRSTRQIYKDRMRLNEDSTVLPGRSALHLDVSLTKFIQVMNQVDPHRSHKKDTQNPSFQDLSGMIKQYRLNYSSELFAIFDTCLFKGKLKSKEIGLQLLNLLNDHNPFKLRMNFTMYDDLEFAWYIPIPSKYFINFKQGISDFVADDFQVIWINYGSTANFTFWPENFDYQAKEWKVDSEYFIESPFR